MENPRSWDPLTKAVNAAAEAFYKIVAVCGGPEPLDIKARIMASKLVEGGSVAAANEARACEVILQALNDHRRSVESGVCGLSMQSCVANALMVGKLAI